MATLKLRLAEGEKRLDSLLRHGIEVAHDCGGTLACATCRVIVREGLEEKSLGAATEDERDILDKASSFEPGARLACQAESAAKATRHRGSAERALRWQHRRGRLRTPLC
jgi:ferredoxin